MGFKTPSFWYQAKPSFTARLLTPLSWLYGLGRRLHCAMEKPQALSDVPVLCLGNVNAGGSGKTPSALALMKVIQAHKLANNPVFLLRGYGGACEAPQRVDQAVHGAQSVGEEALLLARKAPVYVARNRYEGAQLALRGGADLILMDDGLQNRTLQADVNIVVLDGVMGFGNGQKIPAGPLREDLQTALARADAAFVLGKDDAGVQALLPAQLPVFSAQLDVVDGAQPDPVGRYFAFAGLGYPQKFFRYLRERLGLTLVAQRSFADHHAYSAQDVLSLLRDAQALEATLITTEKDMRQLDRLRGAVDLTAIQTLPVELHFADPAALLTFLKERLQG